MTSDQLPCELLWLLDAPLFIDEKQVDALYDAVVRPDYEGVSVTLSDTISSETTFGGGMSIGAMLPWLGGAKLDATVDHTHGSGHGQDRTLRPVSNAYRHLLALALHYAGSEALQDRVLLVHTGEQTIATAAGTPMDASVWRDESYVTAIPRALVFLDLSKARMIPTALELDSGRVVLLFTPFAETLTDPGSPTVESYPGPSSSPEKRDEYWGWYSAKFDDSDCSADRKALLTVEDAVGDHRVSWIDYRVPLGDRGGPPFLHLHLDARREFDTGVFAYNLVSRGFKHGIRIVGTLKSEPDLNVLAIFER